jgi:ribonuclease P protein component
MTVTAKKRQSARPPAPARANATSGARSGAPAPLTAKPASGNTFPKSARLLKHAGFQHVYENGRKQFSGNMIFFYILKENASASSPAFGDSVGNDNRVGNKVQETRVQIGLTVGRALGGAVDRNRIKRRMRDVVRHNLGKLQDALAIRGLTAEVVINPKKAALATDIATLRSEVERGFAIIAAANLNPKPAEAPRSR